MKNGLPPGWIVASLEELTEQPRQDIVDGPFGSNLKASSYVATGVPIVRLQNIDRNRFVDKNIRFVTLEKAAELCRHSFRAGDIIITKLGDPVGKACIVPPSLPEGIIVADVVRARIEQRKSLLQFVAYSINSPEVSSELNLEVKGSTRPRVNLRHIRSLKIPVAPLNEQRRIVAKLEKLLNKVDSCQKRLAKIPILLKRFRQAVLAAACSGRLTADWRGENRNADSYIIANAVGSLSDGSDCPSEWCITNLGALVKLVTSGSRGWAKYYAKSGAIFIRAQNINSDVLDLDQPVYVQLPERSEGVRTKVQLYDILITITGANVTRSALVQRQIEEAYVNQHVALVRLNDVRLSKFVFLSVISPMHGRQQLTSSAYGQGKPGLNLDNIRSVVLALPPLSEQREIVRRVDQLFALADQVEARYAKAKQYVDSLKQSILAKAFRGELVPQDPNDEPATVLIERIRETRGIKTMDRSKPRASKSRVAPQNPVL
jgi:type I restriction enzyme S subunit